MQQALGSRATLPAPLRAQARGASAARSVSLLVQCSKKVTKKAQVVLTQNVPNLGNQGLLTSVRLGYYRCGPRARRPPARHCVATRVRPPAAPRRREAVRTRTPQRAAATRVAARRRWQSHATRWPLAAFPLAPARRSESR